MGADELKDIRDAIAAGRPQRDRMREDWGHYMTPEEILADEIDRLEAERDKLRTTAIEALGYGADFLVAVLCTARTVDAGLAGEFADKIAEMTSEVPVATDYEIWTLDQMGEALRDVRSILDKLGGELKCAAPDANEEATDG